MTVSSTTTTRSRRPPDVARSNSVRAPGSFTTRTISSTCWVFAVSLPGAMEGWNFDVSYQHAQIRLTETRDGFTNLTNLALGINTVSATAVHYLAWHRDAAALHTDQRVRAGGIDYRTAARRWVLHRDRQ